MMQAVIMAGGQGTRLREITKDEIPKPMAQIAGKPILQWQLECLRKQGVTDIVLIIGHLGHKIRDYFGDGNGFGVSITYLEETKPLGTAGSLALLPPLLKNSAFFLILGDIVFDLDLERMLKFHREKRAEATLFVHPNTHPYDSDLVICDKDDKVWEFNSKHNIREGWYHNCVNGGIYLLENTVCNYVVKGERCDLEKELLSTMVKAGASVYAYHSPEYVKDVGTVDRIQQSEEEIKCGYVASKNLRNPQRAIFLDRDGTINRKNGFIYCQEQFELESCAIDAIRMINKAGYLAIVVTNQPVVARGLCEMEDVEEIHKKLETLLGRKGVYLDDIRFCPHHPDKGYPEENPIYKIPCHCRKPDIGMILDCAQKYHIDLSKSWMIGDSTVDIQTGKNAGTKTALVLTGDAGKDGKYKVFPDIVCDNLLDAVQVILHF